MKICTQGRSLDEMVGRHSFIPYSCTQGFFSCVLRLSLPQWKARGWLETYSLVAQLVKNPLAVQETRFDSWVGKIHWQRDRLPTPVFLGFPGGSAGKESTCNVRDLGSIPGLGRSPGGGHCNPLQNSCLGNPMDRGAWRAAGIEVAKSWT